MKKQGKRETTLFRRTDLSVNQTEPRRGIFLMKVKKMKHTIQDGKVRFLGFLIDGEYKELFYATKSSIKLIFEALKSNCIEFSDEEIPEGNEAVLSFDDGIDTCYIYRGAGFRFCRGGIIELFGKIPDKIYWKPIINVEWK